MQTAVNRSEAAVVEGGAGAGAEGTPLPGIDAPRSIAPRDARELSRLFFDRLAVLEEGTHEYQYARNTLIEMNMSLVRFAAASVPQPRPDEMEDIVQVGMIGLIKAIDRFELAREVEFTSFARPLHRRRDQAVLPRHHLGRPRPAPAPGSCASNWPRPATSSPAVSTGPDRRRTGDADEHHRERGRRGADRRQRLQLRLPRRRAHRRRPEDGESRPRRLHRRRRQRHCELVEDFHSLAPLHRRAQRARPADHPHAVRRGSSPRRRSASGSAAPRCTSPA